MEKSRASHPTHQKRPQAGPGEEKGRPLQPFWALGGKCLWTFAMYKNEIQEALAQKHPKAPPRGPKRYQKKKPKGTRGLPKDANRGQGTNHKITQPCERRFIYIYIYIYICYSILPVMSLYCPLVFLWVPLGFFEVVPLDSHFSGQVCVSHDRGILGFPHVPLLACGVPLGAFGFL